MQRPWPQVNGAAVDLRADPSLPRGEGQHTGQDDTRRDRRAFEVFDLAAAAALRELLRGDVEAREAAHPAADEVDEDDPVPAAVEPRGERERGGGDTEGDDVGEGIELAPERRVLLPPARD